MFRISTSGYNYSHNRCVDIVEWFVNEYLSRYTLDINVHHRRLLKRDGVFGWAWVSGCEKKPREFEVELHNQMNIEDYTKTLLHEMWHVYQHVKKMVLCEDEAYKMEEVLYEDYRKTQLSR